MPDYREMYLKMLHASEKAINILIGVQRECEELYIAAHASESEGVFCLEEEQIGKGERGRQSSS